MTDAKPEIHPCPRCGGAVALDAASDGGRHETRDYAVKCASCGLREECFPSNCSGRRRDAIREWNRWSKGVLANRAAGGRTPHTKQQDPSPAPPPPRSSSECEHGSLRRSCEICERDAEIAQLKQALNLARNGLEPSTGYTHRHKKRGGRYAVLATATLQTSTPIADDTPLTVYKGEDGRVWVRPTVEFEDGRFSQLPDIAEPAEEMPDD